MDPKIRIHPGRRKRSKTKVFLGLLFLLIISLLFFLASGGDSLSRITGNVIGVGSKGSVDEANSFKIKASLNSLDSEMSFNQDIESISFEIKGRENILYFGESSFNLTSNSEVIVEGFEGKVSFDNGFIYSLEGRAQKIIINGLPVSSSSRKFKISLGQSIEYNYINLKGVYLREFLGAKTGNLDISEGKLSFKLSNETILIQRFYGDIGNGRLTNAFGVGSSHLVFDGRAENIEVEGVFKTAGLK